MTYLVQALNESNLTAEQLGLFIPVLTETLSSGGSSSDQLSQPQHATSSQQLGSSASNLKIEAITFLRQIVRHLPLPVFIVYLDKIIPALCAATNDRFYKISAEALRTCGDLVMAITKDTTPPASVEYIFPVILQHARTLDADQEVRENAVNTLGIICARASQSILLADALAVLFERCNNEGTQVVSLRALRTIVQADANGSAVNANTQIIIQQNIEKGAHDIVRLVRTGRRPTKIVALSAMTTFIEV
jgi:cullin-associated NEDD8-dissociated protein 1